MVAHLPSGYDQYEWSNGDTGNESIVPLNGEVFVTVTNFPNCSVQDSTKVQQIDCITDFPNVFTPDGDGHNQTFKPQITSGIDMYAYHLTIFNRWGEIVFESFNYEFGWNGTYGDQGLVEDGVYVWQIEFKETMSDKRHTHRGHVTVLK